MRTKKSVWVGFFVGILLMCCTQYIHSTKPVYIRDSMYLADPSAHVFNNRIYIYTSHDVPNDKPNAKGDYYDMKDSRVISFDLTRSSIIENKQTVSISDIAWAGRQVWAPDCASRNGKFYLYYPVKDKNDIFRIGVAVAKKPTGPFKAVDHPIIGSYSIDPAVFEDSDGEYYIYFGGLSGGQLGNYRENKLISCGFEPENDSVALLPKVAKLTTNMLEFSESPRDVKIIDESGQPILAGDKNRKFYEGVWVHKYKNKYYLSYSTGSTHLLCYAISDSPYGPFTYKGVLLTRVEGWTTHHSVIVYQNKWYLFYHDSKHSGKSNLRNIKFRELKYNQDGTIETMNGLD